LTLEKQDGLVSNSERRDRLQYTNCEEIVASIKRLEEQEDARRSLATTEF
jgi:hypothetical protein